MIRGTPDTGDRSGGVKKFRFMVIVCCLDDIVRGMAKLKKLATRCGFGVAGERMRWGGGVLLVLHRTFFAVSTGEAPPSRRGGGLT